jgi:hypothetical protein
MVSMHSIHNVIKEPTQPDPTSIKIVIPVKHNTKMDITRREHLRIPKSLIASIPSYHPNTIFIPMHIPLYRSYIGSIHHLNFLITLSSRAKLPRVRKIQLTIQDFTPCHRLLLTLNSFKFELLPRPPRDLSTAVICERHDPLHGLRQQA